MNGPTENCRIFVSRKRTDSDVIEEDIRNELNEHAADRLEFFDDIQIQPGDKWRERIREELASANILLLVLTKPAKDDFDWCLYEAGLFEDLGSKDPKRVVCVHADGIDPPSQLADHKVVRAEPGEVLELLTLLYHDASFTNTTRALNPAIPKDKLRSLATRISNRINGIDSDTLADEAYGNYWIRLVLPKGINSLEDDVEVESDGPSLKALFELNERPAEAECYTWGNLRERTPLPEDPLGFNLRWMDELREEIRAKRLSQAQRSSRQLTGRFLGRDRGLYQPEVEVYRTYADGRMTVEITFSPQTQDSWLEKARPPVALAAMLALASRARHELIEPYLFKLGSWQPDEALAECLDKMQRVKDTIEQSGFFIRRLTESNLEEAFRESVEELGEYRRLEIDYGTAIRPKLERAVEERDAASAIEALRAWRDNNQRFFTVGLKVYSSHLGLKEPPDGDRQSGPRAVMPATG